MPRTLAITRALLRASLATALQYRQDFLLGMATGGVRALAVVLPLVLVYTQTDDLLGWSRAEASLIMALFLLMEGLVGGFIEPNLGMVVEAVRRGTLDLVLLKPADAQLLVSVRTVNPARLWDGLAGLVVGAWALAQLPTPSVGDVLLAAALFLAGLVALYSVWLLAICTSFFFVRVDNLKHLLWSASDAGRWPIQVFPLPVQVFFTGVLPIALVTTLPANALRGQAGLGSLVLATAIATAFAWFSRRVWQWSLANYTSASS